MLRLLPIIENFLLPYFNPYFLLSHQAYCVFSLGFNVAWVKEAQVEEKTEKQIRHTLKDYYYLLRFRLVALTFVVISTHKLEFHTLLILYWQVMRISRAAS